MYICMCSLINRQINELHTIVSRCNYIKLLYEDLNYKITVIQIQLTITKTTRYQI